MFPNYDQTPKAVIAAIAMSFAILLEEENVEEAKNRILKEWSILHSNGIVPQKPKGDL
jgi:hypothetical protein